MDKVPEAAEMPPSSALGRNVRLLAGLLGQIIYEQHGQNAFSLVEQIRLAAKARRAGQPGSTDELRALLQGLDLAQTHILIKAFTHYFQLINIAEDQERIRVVRERENQGTLKEGVEVAIQQLRAAGLTGPQMRALLERTHIRLVLTAHPTEAKRKEILIKLRHVAQMMGARNRHNPTPSELRHLDAEIAEEIEELWQTRMTRANRPTLDDEVDFGVYFITSVIMNVAVDLYGELQTALETHYPDEDWTTLPVFLKYASWIGGDRDGNPNVTPEATLATIEQMRAAARAVYLNEIATLRDHLTQSTDEAGASEALRQSIPPTLTADTPYPDELYRLKMDQIWQRLAADGYPTSRDLLDDLEVVYDSLRANSGQRVATGAIKRLMRRMKIFGLHLLPLEVRDDARHNAQAVHELFAQYGIAADYLSLPEEEKQLLLLAEIARGRPLFPPRPALSDVANKVIATWRMMADAQERYGPRVIDSVIASMAGQPSDVFTLLLLAREVGIADHVDLVPLFETVDNLASARQTMAVVLRSPAYRQQVEARGTRQQVMVGYSDSGKDGGYMAARWGLHQAQQQLAELFAEEGVTLEVFHGRGGSIGRGGGPTSLSIQSLPPAALHGPIRITEQGEVIAYRYNNASVAHRHLQQVIHAALTSVGLPRSGEAQPAWQHLMELIAAASEAEYRSFVYQSEGFLDYWQQATPINELSDLPIGSRPARRGSGGFEAIRAIPWVFSWMQSRAIIPSWYGVGRGLAAAADQPDGLAHLRQMYAAWPFFTMLIKNVELDLAKADMDIAGLYASLVEDEALRERFFSRIQAEHTRACQLICQVTGADTLLADSAWVKRSIERRNPYIDPLNFIQVELLRRLRRLEPGSAEYAACLQAVLATVNGIAAGMKTTG